MNRARQVSVSIQDSLQAYESELFMTKSALTCRAYMSDIRPFIEHLTQANVTRITAIKPTHIMKYLALSQQTKAKNTIRRYYMAIRSWCRYLFKRGYTSLDLSLEVYVPKGEIPATRIPTLAEIQAIMQGPNIEDMLGLRDRAILELLYSSALRATELCQLEVRDLQECSVLVSKGKGDKTRCIPLTVEAYTWVKLYLEEWGHDEGWLFRTSLDRQIKRQLLCKIVAEYSQLAGVAGVTPHTLRHACATHLLDEGADLRLIQDLLGHSNISSTVRYTQLSSHKMKEMFTKFHPRGKS